ncbi:cell wall-binding repeat-containing protein [Candidatus Poriferisodalis sp.]|uniref:cell wall-binding repeat-containing protein n=1 Tax=Candidatus Poriferisodalis sp. TaxID=3101277 RepID=UPI003B51ED11
MIPSSERVCRGAVAAIGCLLASGVLAVVPSVATHPAAALGVGESAAGVGGSAVGVGESVLVVALGSSLSDVGTAASLVAGAQGDAVVLTETADELGPGAAAIVAEQQPGRIVVAGGAAAVGQSVVDELRRLSPGVEIDRLGGSDRIHTAALAAARALSGSGSVTVVLANGWSLPDVGAAASAVASGAADAVLYSSRTTLGEPTRQVLARHRPVRILVAGGAAAVSADVVASAAAAGGGVGAERLGGMTRVETAARVAQRALDAGATTAVLANGWSLRDVGIAASLAAALPGSVVLYTESDSLGAATKAALSGHSIDHVFLVGAVDTATTQLLADIESKLGVTQITEATHASLHALGAAAPASQSRFVAVSAAADYACGIEPDGTAVCWGDDGRDDAADPAGTFSSLSLGQSRFALDYSCGLRLNGTVSCWPSDRSGGSAAPSGVFDAVSVGSANSVIRRPDGTLVIWRRNACGLRSDGTVECWGDTNTGVNDVPDGSYIEITVGRAYACGLRSDGPIECWGHGVEAMPPAGTFVSVTAAPSGAPLPQDDSGLALLWRERHSDTCGVRPSGTVECWGRRYQGDDALEVPSGAFRSVSPNVTHACGIRTDSSVECWGDNYGGQLGAPHGAYRAVSLGSEHTCGLRLDGTVVCWGENSHGQLEVPERDGASSLAPRLSSDAASVVGVGTPFEVDVRFPRAVSGLEVDDFDVVNGDATALSGSGASYRVTAVARSPGAVVVRVPEGATHDRLGYGNEKSRPVAVTVTDSGADAVLGIDTWDRGAVLAAYQVEYEREEPEWGYTGDVAGCVAGTTSQEFRDSIIQRANWYRRMAGLTTVTENANFSRTAQHAALMMSAEGWLSHSPGDEWKCYSETGALGARSSNLFLGGPGVLGGSHGLRVIDGYIRDSGANNVRVGHRTWILLPQQATMGTGDVPHGGAAHRAANALYVLGPRSSTREVRQPRAFVAWPPPGYVPYTSVFGRWSFGLAALEWQCGQPALWQCRPDVSEATVVMADESGPVDIEIIARADRLTEATIVWAVGGDTDSAVHAKPDDAEHCYTVTISGIRVEGTVEDPYEYMTCVFDPDAAG